MELQRREVSVAAEAARGAPREGGAEAPVMEISSSAAWRYEIGWMRSNLAWGRTGGQ